MTVAAIEAAEDGVLDTEEGLWEAEEGVEEAKVAAEVEEEHAWRQKKGE